MKANKKILISVLLVLVMLCVMGSTSAEDTSIDKNLTTSDTDEIAIEEGYSQDGLEVSDSEEKLSAEHTVNSYSELTTAITNADNGDTIKLNDGTYEFPSSTGTITLTKSLTFKGESKNGVSIVSAGTYSIFSVADDGISLNIQNLNFNGVSTSGSGIVAIGGTGNLDIKDCSFENCQAKAGAVRFYSSGNCTINGLVIKDHQLSYSSATNYAVALTLTGAGTYTLDNVLIDNANYTWTSSSTRGVIYIQNQNAKAIINNLTIMNCGGNMYGIINNAGTTTITNSKITRNTIPGATGNAIIRNSNKLTINQTIISENIASNPNGGYIIQDAGSSSLKTVLELNYNNIYGNNATNIYVTTNNQYVESVNADYNYWGSNYDNPDELKTATNIEQSTWANKDGDNFVDQNGQPLAKEIPTLNDGGDEPEVEYDLYVDCYAADGGDGSKLNPFNSISAAVSAASGGESIFIRNGEYTQSAKLSLTKSLSLIGESKDGVIISSSSEITIFEMIESGVVLSFDNLTFSNINSGSSVPIKIGGDSNVDITNCSFIGCSSKFGAIQLFTTGTATVSDCTIKNFKTGASGSTGGIYLSGNGIYNVQNTIIDNSQFTASSGYMYGIIYVSGKTSVTTLDNVTISNCCGSASSVIYAKSKVTVKNSKIINNTVQLSATGFQGESVFYTNYNANNNPNPELVIEQTIISDNVCPNNFVYANNANAKVTLNYCYIQNNTVGTTFATTIGNFDFEYNYWGSNDAPTDPTVTRYAVMDSQEHFTDDLGNELAKEIPLPSEEGGDEPAVLDIIYVSDSGSDDNDGSMSAPVKSIAKAVELAQKGKIVILAGDYTLTETLSIDKDLDIEGRGAVLIKGSSQIISTSKALNLTNIKFDSTADVSGAIISTTGDLNIDSCAVYADTQSGSAIYIDGGNANIANSILINPTGYALTVSNAPTTIVANNNWWGKNDAANTNANVASWIVMDAGVDLAKINAGDEVTITVTFTKTNSGSDYAGTLPEFYVKVTANELNQNISVKSNQASVKYTVNADDEATVTSGNESVKVPLKLYDPPEIIYVDGQNGADTNDGDEVHPVKTISKAIELAKKGKIIILEGTYTIDNTLTVNDNLDITGQGDVIIDGNSKRILNNNADLNITNVKFTNGFDSSAVIVNNGNLTLTNTMFYSNVNLNGFGASVVRNNKKLTVTDSKFYENKERYGNIYNNAGELLIRNSKFFNNDVTSVTTVAYGLAVYSEGGNALIENSKFYNNKGNFSVIYFMSKDSLSSSVVNNLTVDNCTFENNELVRYGVIHSQKANTTIRDSTFTDNIVRKGSTSDADGGAIYVYGQKVSVEKSVFINNKADRGNDIYAYAGELEISDSVLINENGYSIVNSSSATVTANDNWWGANTPNVPFAVERWVVMTVSSNDTEIETGDTVNIVASFDKTNDGNDYVGELPEVINVTFKSTGGNLDEVKTIKDKKAEVTYTVDTADKKITVSSGDANETFRISRILDIVYVSPDGDDNNDGDRETPVKSIAMALELAVKGQIVILPGTYKTGYLGIIDTDLNITGEGRVIIDADNNNRILYVYNTSNVVIKNLIFTNGYTTEALDESGALIGSAGNLTIDNCTFANSKSEKNGGAIYNAGNLKVIGCTFENNTAEECGGAIFTQKSGNGIIPSLSVDNSVFRNNTAKGKSRYGGGAIYVQQAADGVSIVNSIFEDNKCVDYGGGAVEIAQTNVALIDNCTFISNSANGEDYKTRSDYGGGAISFKGFYSDTRETLTVTNSLFLDNTANEYGGGAVFAMYSTVNVKNSVLINNGDDHGIYVYGRDADLAPAKVNANDNWWGSNDNPKQYINRGTISRWAVLTISNASEIKAGETVKLTVSINHYTTGSANGTLDNPIKVERPVTIYTNLGNIEGTLVNGEFTTDYAVPEGLKIISATVDGENQVLFVISTQTTIKAGNITGAMGDRVDYTINLTTTDGSTVNTGKVEVYFGDNLVATIPVNNNQSKASLMINRPTGEYQITVKYIDETREFVAGDATATLNVTGINNIVTPETFSKFFDDEGELISDIPFDEIIFKGTFNDMGVLTINKAIRITGENALFNNTAFKLDANNIELNNIEISLNKNFEDIDGAAIYVGGNNAVISNSNITYNAPDNVQSYAIEVDVAKNVKIINNNINYTAKSDGTVKTIAINALNSDNLVVENNVLNANVPSVDLDYSAYPIVGYYSQGVHIENSNNVSFDKNDITVNYTTAAGYADTIYAVNFENSNNSRVTDNGIVLNGHSYAYGLVTNNCENITISGNDIKSNSDDHYALGLQVGGKSTASADNNNISAKSNDVVYPVYLDDWQMGGEVNLTNNNVKGESDTVYGVYVEEDKVLISGNTIDVLGNHVYGAVTHQTDAVIDGNYINATGRDVGDIVSPQSGVNENTTGIIVSEGQAEITNNKVVTNGKSTIAAINTNATVKNNGLTANGTVAEDSISSVNSTVVASGNTAAKGNDTPTAPVVMITGQNNAKVDYGFTYTVRVTEDGKSVGAGKVVTLKIAGKTLTAKTDKDGYAKFTLAVKPKAYTVTVTYNKISQNYKVTVKNVIKAKNLKVKKSAKMLKIKVTLKTSAKKPIKGKKVILKIKGKKYKAKTNKKGVATFKVKKNLLKKLKAGKKYKYQVTYGKDTVKKTLKVKK